MTTTKTMRSGSTTPRWLVLSCALFGVVALPRAAAAAIATTVSAGSGRTCAVTAASDLRCWGEGPTGDGTEELRRLPVDVAALAGNAAAVAVGSGHDCAVTTSGGVQCWGWNGRGQIGGGTLSTTILTPLGVAGLATTASAVAVGADHSCALLTSGDVQCWGANGYGQLGDGTTDDSTSPVTVVGIGAAASAIVTSGFSTCVVTSAGGVRCWGLSVGSPTPVDLAGLTGGIADLALGSSHACVLTSAGGVKCFGENDAGQLGDGTTTPSATPVDVTGLTSGVAAIDSIGKHSCALTTAGAVKCWGRNDRGQLGDGSKTDRAVPTEAVGLAGGVVGVATGAAHACARKSDGSLLCWGNDFFGATGTGWIFAFESRPDNVVDFGPPVCAILDPGQLFATRPLPRLVVKQGRYEIDLALTASVEFALPAGVSFADLDPESDGLRLQIRNQLGAVRVDARLHGGAYAALQPGWQRNAAGTAWTYRANGFTQPFGVRRAQIRDRSHGAPGGRVQVTVRAGYGLFPVDDDNDPVEVTVILGDDASAAAGKCGRSAYVAGQCTENEPGTVLKCK